VGVGDGVQFSKDVPVPSTKEAPKKLIIAIKVHKVAPITEDNFQKEIVFIEIYKNPLECMSNIARVSDHLNKVLGRILPDSQQPRQPSWMV
jgi:hypothetical protein